ncbi:MAG: hypothetical protein KGL39_32675 [Patescibacteria group bacterium]|nr:hypothetical protein [Patescibacteria group bacterium]
MNDAADLIRSMLVEPCRPAEHAGDPTDDECSRLIKLVPPHHSVTQPEQMTQFLAWPAQDLPPLNRAANTAANQTGWAVGPVNMSLFYRAMGKLSCGAGTAGCTTNCQFFAGNTSNSLQAITGAAWNWQAVPSGPIQTVTSTAGQVTIEMRSDQMPKNTNYLLMVVANQCAQLFDAQIICAGGAYRPSSQYNCTATLTQQVM